MELIFNHIEQTYEQIINNNYSNKLSDAKEQHE